MNDIRGENRAKNKWLRDSEEFFWGVRKLWQNRCRFTSFVGAGLSIGSGIPGIPFVRQHLTYCLDLWLRKGWDPRKGNWPPLSEAYVTSISEIQRRWRDVLAGELLLQDWTDKEQQDIKKLDYDHHEYINRALGASMDWREALELLSRARVDRGRRRKNESNPNPPCILEAPDFTVHDSYFQFLVRGKEPSLGHRMLAALADQLRIRLVLTTNFDDLIEQAFGRNGFRLAAYSVHRDASLPSPKLVLSHPSVVKLHGGRYGLRTDWSLDAHPGEGDKRAFVSYLAGEDFSADDDWKGVEFGKTANSRTDRVGLLVAGLSGTDRRIRGMIKEAMRRLPELEVFWIAHSPSDCQRLTGYFPDDYPDQPADSDACKGNFREELIEADVSPDERFHVIQGDAGLLMLQLYQFLTDTIPPTGSFFPTSWNLSYPPTIPITKDNKERFHDAKKMVREAVRGALVHKHPIVHVQSDQAEYGSLTVCGALFRENLWTELEKNPEERTSVPATECAWIDLDDVLRQEHVFYHMIGIMGRRSGLSDPRPHFPYLDDSAPFSDRISEWFLQQCMALNLAGAPVWVFFLNGRDQPGTNQTIRANERGNEWDNPNVFLQQWYETIKKINDANKITLHVVLITAKQTPPWSLVEDTRWNELTENLMIPDLTGFRLEHANEMVEKWCVEEDTDFRKALLYVIIESDFVRYVTGVRRAVYEYLRSAQVERVDGFDARFRAALKFLESERLFRLKPGGFIWMNLSLRQRMREKSSRIYPAISERLRLQSLIGRWYGRLFISSMDPRAALETANHALVAVKIFLKESKKALQPEAIPYVFVTLRHARLVLKTAAEQLRRVVAEEQTAMSFKIILNRLAEFTDVDMLSGLRTELESLEDTVSRVSLSVWQVERNGPDIQKLIERLEEREERKTPGGKAFGSKARDTVGSVPTVLDEAKLTNAFVDVTRRNYDSAHVSLNDLLSKVFGTEPMSGEDPAGGKLISLSSARKWLSEEQPTVETVEFVIRICRSQAYLHMHLGQAAYLASSRDALNSGLSADVQKMYLEKASLYCEVGLELLRGYPGNNEFFVYHQHARLRAHLGLIRAREAAGREQGSEAATRIYNYGKEQLLDAEAFAIEFPLVEDVLSRAIILLRRTELKLIRVRSTTAFRNIHLSLVKSETMTESRERIAEIRKNIPSPKVCSKEIRLLHDVWECIDRADEHLTAHLKNEWWPQLAFVLRVQAIESYMIILLDQGWLGKENPSPDSIPYGWSRDIYERMMSFLDKDILRFPTSQSRGDIFFVGRILEALLNLRALGFGLSEKVIQKYLKPLLPEVGKEVHPEIIRYISLVKRRVKSAYRR